MKHSDSLTDQQKIDCAILGVDWDQRADQILTNFSQEAARMRVHAAIAKIAGLPMDAQDAAIQAALGALPAAAVQAAIEAGTAKLDELTSKHVEPA